MGLEVTPIKTNGQIYGSHIFIRQSYWSDQVLWLSAFGLVSK
jgi:hypothetical protein